MKDFSLAYIHLGDYVKSFKKREEQFEKRIESFSKEKKVTAKQHSMHAFMISTTVSCIDFNKAYPSIDIFIDG